MLWKEEMPICLQVWGLKHLRNWAFRGASLNFQPLIDLCLEIKFYPWLGLEAALMSLLRVRGRMEEEKLAHSINKIFIVFMSTEFCLKTKSDGLRECKNSAFSLAAAVAYGLFFWGHNSLALSLWSWEDSEQSRNGNLICYYEFTQ